MLPANGTVREFYTAWKGEIIDLLFYGIVFLYTLYLFLQTSEFRDTGALLPRTVSYVIFALVIVGLVKLVVEVLARLDRLPNAIVEAISGDGDDGLLDSEESPPQIVSLLGNLAGVIAYIVMLSTLGFFSSTFLFSTAYIYANKRNAVRSVAWGVGLTVLLYLIFIRLLNFTLILREGMLF